MNKDQKEAFDRYEELKGVVKEAEEEMEKLKPLIIPLVPQDKELLTEKGYFYIQQRPTWTYTKATELAATALKATQKSEIAKGLAVAEYKPALYYKSGRPEPRE